MIPRELTNDSERAYAEYLDANSVAWTRPRIPAFRFAGTTYTPDFYLPLSTQYVEVIGSRQRWHQLESKIHVFRHLFQHVDLLVIDVSRERQASKRNNNGLARVSRKMIINAIARASDPEEIAFVRDRSCRFLDGRGVKAARGSS
jgi:hypothetical protein